MTPTTETRRTVISIDSPNPFERGMQRSAALGGGLHSGIDLYMKLFRTVGIDVLTVRSDAHKILETLERWSPDQVSEMQGIATAAGVDLWQVMALNARTEILSQAIGTRPGECSTIGSVSPGQVFGVQTWDWHEELDNHWHLQRVAGTKHGFVGMTEHGMLGKIGMNDAGVSVFLNILGHSKDSPQGVPIHLLAAHLLARASSVEEAVEIASTAPVGSSSALTIMDETSAVTVELSPVGAAVLRPVGGTLVHTNHFLNSRLSAGEKQGLYNPDSTDRLLLVQSRLDRYPAPTDVDDIVAFLYSDQDQPGLCCEPKPGATFGNRWTTLATITMDNARREMRVVDGSPIQARAGAWNTMSSANAPADKDLLPSTQ